MGKGLNILNITHSVPHGMLLKSLFSLLSSGASACVQLNQFEEAITWCDKGLAVSFEKYLHEILTGTQI